jgi:hypothetical protein
MTLSLRSQFDHHHGRQSRKLVLAVLLFTVSPRVGGVDGAFYEVCTSCFGLNDILSRP